jgi:GT2 family glycosyltransferase
VAVVVVSFNAREVLLACLDSLRRYVGVPFETVVVDNASGDGSAEAARARKPAPQVIANTVNVGFARACNQGLHLTAAPHVLFLNPDATVTAGAIEVLTARLDDDPDIGVVGPLTRHPDGTVQVSTGRRATSAAARSGRGSAGGGSPARGHRALPARARAGLGVRRLPHGAPGGP